MSITGLVSDESKSRMLRVPTIGLQDAQTEPILDQESHQADGILVSSLQERVAVFAHQFDALALPEVSRFRRLMAKAQARRAVLYVATSCSVPQPVMLLATLSKIEILRVAPTELPLF